jgi:plastocyanin domain-containing protein
MQRSRFALRVVALAATLAASACGRTDPPPRASASPTPGAPYTVVVDAQGFHPPTLNAPAGQTVRLTFRRTSDEGCGQQVVFPTLHLQRDLPLNTDVAVDITVPPQGSLAFTCGMGMLRGSVVAQ